MKHKNLTLYLAIKGYVLSVIQTVRNRPQEQFFHSPDKSENQPYTFFLVKS